MTVAKLSLPGAASEQHAPRLLSGDAAGPAEAGRIPPARRSWSDALTAVPEASSPVRVLIVGRDLNMLRSVETALADMGLTSVSRVTEVASAVLALRRGIFGLVVSACDLCGPNGGLVLIDWLRLRGPELNRGVPAVVLAPSVNRSWLDQAAKAGVTQVLPYPLNLGDFQVRIGRLVQVRQLAASDLGQEWASVAG